VLDALATPAGQGGEGACRPTISAMMPGLPSVLVTWARIAGPPHHAGQDVIDMLGRDAQGQPWADHAGRDHC
jgi:hypothetical protein